MVWPPQSHDLIIKEPVWDYMRRQKTKELRQNSTKWWD